MIRQGDSGGGIVRAWWVDGGGDRACVVGIVHAWWIDGGGQAVRGLAEGGRGAWVEAPRSVTQIVRMGGSMWESHPTCAHTQSDAVVSQRLRLRLQVPAALPGLLGGVVGACRACRRAE